jgi:hypothetical protein
VFLHSFQVDNLVASLNLALMLPSHVTDPLEVIRWAAFEILARTFWVRDVFAHETGVFEGRQNLAYVVVYV